MTTFCQNFFLTIMLLQSIVLPASAEMPTTLSKDNYETLFNYLENAHDHFPEIIKQRKQAEANHKPDTPFPVDIDSASISIKGVYFSPLDKTEKAYRQSIYINLPNFTSVRDFVSALDKRYHGKVKTCSRSDSYAYRISSLWTLRLDFQDDIYRMLDIVPAESLDLLSQHLDQDDTLTLSLILLEGGLSDDCDLSTLTKSEYISPAILDTLVKTFVAYPHDVDKLKTTFSRFGKLKQEDSDCETTLAIEITPTFSTALSIAKPKCQDKNDTILSIYYVVPHDENGHGYFYDISQDPFMAVKWIKAMEKNLPSERVDNLFFSLWKKGDMIGIISDPKPDENLSFSIGIYHQEDSQLIKQIYENGNLPLAKQWEQLMPDPSHPLMDELPD